MGDLWEQRAPGSAGSAILPLLLGNHLWGDSCWVSGPLWLSLSSQGGAAGGRWASHPSGALQDSHIAEYSDMGREGVFRYPQAQGGQLWGAYWLHPRSDGPCGVDATMRWTSCVALTCLLP